MSDTPHTQSVMRDGRPTHLLRRSYCFTFAKETHRFSDDAIALGSHAENGLVVAHPTVSRFHARLELDRLGFLLTDLGSRNGTFINGMRINAAYLEHGVKLLLGDAEGKFELARDQVQLPLAEEDNFGALRGSSAPMRRLFQDLKRVAPLDSTVLVQGETGTGKDLVATEIHRHSQRAQGPLVVVDCGALPESLVDSELFGHERGAFTGAEVARQGAFEQADGGTIVLDEIGELPLAVQAKLLRALESRTIRRVGGGEVRKVDVRVVAATHRDLVRMCAAQQFREDLYFRLAVIAVRVPPLRERLEDLPALIEATCEESGQPFECAPEILALLEKRPWPGNVRELRNLVQRAQAFGPQILTEVERQVRPEEEPYRVAKAKVIEQFDRQYLLDVLTAAKGNVAEAARAAQVDRVWIFRLVKRYQIDLAELRRGR